jgi:hypothetical protein
LRYNKNGVELVAGQLFLTQHTKDTAMSTSAQEAARERAIQPSLIAVKEAIEKWARASSDGAKVWEVAEILPDMWHDWGMCLGSDAWGGLIGNVNACLTDIAVACDGQGVAEAVAAAKTAIALYREQP